MVQGEYPVFGERKPGQSYVPRPGAYGILRNDQGWIAVLETPRGCFLPGGGSEGGETPEETLVREVREECGFRVQDIRRIGEAVEYVYTEGNEAGIRKECVFFVATVVGILGPPTEPDHTVLWLPLEEADLRLVHGSQQWALAKAMAYERQHRAGANE